MKIRGNIKKTISGLLLPAVMCAALPLESYAAGAAYGTTDSSGTGGIRYYTEAFTVHRVDWESSGITENDVNSVYGVYSQGFDGDKAVVGSKAFLGRIDETKYGKADYSHYSIIPFGDEKTSSTNGGLTTMAVEFKDYMQTSLGMQDYELYDEYFLNKEIKRDEEGNVLSKPVIFECNGVFSILSKNGAGRDQYSLQSPSDGWWFLGGVNEQTGEFYGHQYTLQAGMIPTEKTEDTGGWYWNRDGQASEYFRDTNSALQSFLGHKTSEFMKRMNIRFFKTFFPGKTPNDTPVITWETTGSYGRDWPEVYTYNTSDEFNLGEGIPSGESYTNGFLTNKWFGTYGWGKTRTIKKTFTVSHPINATYLEEHEYEDDEGETHIYYTREHYSVCPTLTTTREAYYYGVRSADIYEFKDADVSNGSYGVPPHYENPSKIPVTLDINENSVTTYDTDYKTDADKHVRFYPESGSVTRPYPGEVDTGYSEKSESWFVSHLNLQEQDDTDTGIYVTTHNDSLSINGKVYMDPTEKTSHVKGEIPEMEPPKSINILNIAQNPDSGGDFKCVWDETGIDIPIGVRNDKYTTSFTSRYVRRTPEDNQLHTVDKSGKEATYNPYDSNEPVVVHTPVISPVKITDPETETQLASQPPSHISSGEELYKLRLDGTYTLEFQPAQWFSAEFGELLGYENTAMTADRYDKYVKQKLVKFPYPVTIIWPSGSRTYCPLKADNYTEWIKFPDSVNTLQFYVPSWVTESHTLWGKSNAPGSVYDVKFRVEAQNVIGDTGEDDTEEEALNSVLENHVATYDIYTNISGSIYGFEIVGINDRDMFKGYSTDVNETDDYPFALNLEEKKASTKNRFGKPYLRYALTGEVTDKWDARDTLPLRPGSSHRYQSMGTIWKGTKFSFRFKTIANLGDTNDQIEITPTFRYVDKSTGTVTEQKDLRIYYTDKSGNYIEYGSRRDKDLNVKKVQLKDPQFEGSWYQGGKNNTSAGILSFLSDDLRSQLIGRHGNSFVDDIKDDLLFTVGDASKRQPYLNKEHASYSLSKIVLDPGMRILSGNQEEFEENQRLQKTDSYFDKGEYMIKNADGSGTGVDVKTFRKSMQTWYGQYQIPDQLFVCKKNIDIDGDGVASTLDSHTGDSGYHSGDDLNHDGTVDLEDYALKGNLSTDSPIWLKSGYLVLNFSIKTYNNGTGEAREHLVYGGLPASGQLNMWGPGHEDQVDTVRLESSETTEQPYSDDNKMANPSHGSITYNVKDGDIAIISMNEKLSDKLQPRIFMIN